MPSIKLIVTDIDGTLLDSHHQLGSNDAGAIRDAQEAGVHVVFASSRPPRAVIPLLASCGLQQAFVIAYQGAMTMQIDGSASRIVSEDPIPLAAARRVLSNSTVAGGDVNWYAGERWLVSQPSDRITAESRIVGFNPEIVDLTNVTIPAHKLLILLPEDVDNALLDVIGHPDVQAEVSKRGYLEITKRGVDKGRALEAVMGALGIEKHEAMAVGDGANDLSMFRVVGTSIAMGNAPQIVRDAAMYVTSTNDESGFARALYGHALADAP